MRNNNDIGDNDEDASISETLSIDSDIDSIARDFVGASNTFSYNDLRRLGRGHDESKEMVHLQDQLNHYFLNTERVNEIVILANDIDYDKYTDIKSSVMVRHDAFLDGHWRRLADSLHCPCSVDIGVIAIACIQLTNIVMGMLLPSLKQANIYRCVFAKNGFVHHEGITFMSEILEENATLEAFEFIHNPIPIAENQSLPHSPSNIDIDAAMADRLFNSINAHPRLKRLAIIYCDLVCYPRFFSSIISACSALKIVDLRGNCIGELDDEDEIISLEVTLISDLISNNPPLKQLDLRDNCLEDDDATLLANALKKNTNLCKLSIGNNNLTDFGGCEFLHRAIWDRTSLKSVSDSNHTCYLRLCEEEDDEERHVDLRKIQRDIDKIRDYCAVTGNSRKAKVLLTLSKFPVSKLKVSFLHGLPVKLIPEVLHFLQDFISNTNEGNMALSILYDAVIAMLPSHSNADITVKIPCKMHHKSTILHYFVPKMTIAR